MRATCRGRRAGQPPAGIFINRRCRVAGSVHQRQKALCLIRGEFTRGRHAEIVMREIEVGGDFFMIGAALFSPRKLVMLAVPYSVLIRSSRAASGWAARYISPPIAGCILPARACGEARLRCPKVQKCP